MRITFYLQYFSYNDENFEVDNTYYKNSDDYIKQLEESYNQTKDDIFEAMLSGDYNTKNTYKFSTNPLVEKKEKISYTKCEGYLYNENNKEEDINTLLDYYFSQQMIVLRMVVDVETLEEEFSVNWNMYLDSTNKIMSCDADDEWKFTRKPIKDIYFSLENNKGDIMYGKMENVRIEHSNNFADNVLIVDKIVFLKTLE